MAAYFYRPAQSFAIVQLSFFLQVGQHFIEAKIVERMLYQSFHRYNVRLARFESEKQIAGSDELWPAAFRVAELNPGMPRFSRHFR